MPASIGQIVEPIGLVGAQRLEDAVLDSFLRFSRSSRAVLPVLGAGDVLAGVVMRKDVGRC